jgi:hypothetical protein
VLLAVSIAVFAVGVPTLKDTAYQAAIDSGATAEEATLAVSLAIGLAIGALVFASIFEVFKIIGGFMFSLKGRWGIFCIVVAIISAVSTLFTLINGASKNPNVGSIVTNVITLAIDVLLVVACFKRRAELR